MTHCVPLALPPAGQSHVRGRPEIVSLTSCAQGPILSPSAISAARAALEDVWATAVPIGSSLAA